MRKISFVVIISFLTLTVAKGQTNAYVPFPNDSAIWGYEGQYANTGTIYSVIQWLGDTVINSRTYKKQFTNSSDNPFYVYAGLHYSCGIRQDIPNEKLFKIVGGVETDISISQHLHVGDTMPAVFAACPKWPYRIASIDSVQIGHKFHKRYNCKEDSSSLGTESYIVGVGEITYMSCFEGEKHLACFEVNNIFFWGNPNTPFCPRLVSTNDYERLENGLTISPNPFCTSVTLQAHNFLNNATLIVYNSLGQTVKQLGNISGQAIILRRDNLPSGLYFIRLTEDSKSIAADKLVITDN